MYQKWIHNTWTHIVCVIFMCRDKNDTRPAIALEPRRPTPSGAHTSSIGPRTTIVSMWKPPHSSITAGRWIFVPILSHFAKRTTYKFTYKIASFANDCKRRLQTTVSGLQTETALVCKRP